MYFVFHRFRSRLLSSRFLRFGSSRNTFKEALLFSCCFSCRVSCGDLVRHGRHGTFHRRCYSFTYRLGLFFHNGSCRFGRSDLRRNRCHCRQRCGRHLAAFHIRRRNGALFRLFAACKEQHDRRSRSYYLVSHSISLSFTANICL